MNAPSSRTTALALHEASKRLRSLFRELWILPFIMGMGVLLGTMAMAASTSKTYPEMGVILGPIASMPFFTVALVVALSRSITAAWVGFVFELLLMLLLFPSWWMVMAAIVPIMTMSQIHRIRELQALQRKHLRALAEVSPAPTPLPQVTVPPG